MALEAREGASLNIPVNEDAPVRSEGVIEISAPTEAVWGILTQIEGWPTWQSEVTSSEVHGGLEEGVEFNWKAGGIRFASKVHTIVEKRMLGWTGRTFGAFAIHNWTLEESSGSTTVRVEESLEGFLPSLFRKRFQKILDVGVKKNLEDLRSASEAKARE
jgi:uncharacterized membrane protein